MSKVSVVILSQDPPLKLLAELNEQSFQDFETIIANQKGIVTAMNCALEIATGEIFVRIDDDVELPENWLEELIKPFEDPLVAGVTGPTYVPKCFRKYRDSIRNAEKPNWFLRWLFDGDPYAPAKIYKCGSVSYGSNFKEHIKGEYEIDHLEGTNWAVRTELIRQVGGFDPAFSGVAEWYDDDVVFKIKKLGYKIRYNSNAYLWHMLAEGEHFKERLQGPSRISNWLRFHFRHSSFHYKKVIWFFLLLGYFVWKRMSR